MEIIIISGLGRCGSSLTMQMLNAAGIPCNGKYPAFEDDRGSLSSPDPKWLKNQQGRATKILLPYMYPFLPGNYKFIWVDRTPIEQAKSQAKFAHMFVQQEKTREDLASNIKMFFHAYEKDKKRSFKTMKKLGLILPITFEDLIMSPEKTAKQICDFLNIPFKQEMVDVVISRSPEATLNMDIELKQVREADDHMDHIQTS